MLEKLILFVNVIGAIASFYAFLEMVNNKVYPKMLQFASLEKVKAFHARYGTQIHAWGKVSMISLSLLICACGVSLMYLAGITSFLRILENERWNYFLSGVGYVCIGLIFLYCMPSGPKEQ